MVDSLKLEDPESNSDTNEVAEHSRTPTKCIIKKWNYEKTFATKEDAENFIDSEKCWSFKSTNKTEYGIVKYYRCNNVKSRGEQCAAGIKLIFDCSSENVVLHRIEASHSCDLINTKACIGMSEAVKAVIKELFKKKFKPRAVLQHLAKRYKNPPNINQVNNYLVGLRRALYRPFRINLGELKKWLILHQTVPEESTKAFVINYVIDEENEIFRFMVSSTTLLKNATKGDAIIHADATYKLIWQGFPVWVVGTSDRDRKFHIFGIAVASDEQTADFEFIFQSLKDAVLQVHEFEFKPKVLIADASPSIKNGFKNVFGELPIRMCWMQMRSYVEKEIQGLANKANIKQILADIDAIQMSENETVFLTAYNLFKQKWVQESQFLGYFEEQWINQNPNWYKGAYPDTPSTNNVLQSTNRCLKDAYALRERLSLSCFCELVLEIIESFSKTLNNTKYADSVTIDIKTWTSAYQWGLLNRNIECLTDGIYLVSADDQTVINKHIVEEELHQVFPAENFDAYIKKKLSYYKLFLPMGGENWQNGHCSCPQFLKKYMCKHVLGIAIRLNYVQPPAEAKGVELRSKGQRGRSSKKKKAVLVH